MNYNITEEEIKRLQELKGEVRGVVFKTDHHFIINKNGEDGLKKVKDELKKMGVSIDYEEVSQMGYYPISLRIFSLLAISRAFNYNREDVSKMGKNAPRVSFLVKFFTKYFMSSEKTLEKVGELWEKHYTKGRIEMIVVDEENGKTALRLHGDFLHPIFYDYLLGYFSSIISMVVGQKIDKEKVEHFPEEGYHEFYMEWNIKNNS